MNERIEELAAECGFRSNPDLYDRNQSFDIPKFAELIVKECVICAEREWIRNGSDTEHNQAVGKVIWSIKQHFGIDE